MPARTAPLRPCPTAGGDDMSVASSVALECHSRLILEELSAMVDAEGSDYSSSGSEDESDDDDDKDVDDRRMRRDRLHQAAEDRRHDAILHSEVDAGGGGVPGSLAYQHGCGADSELSLDDLLHDPTVSLVRRRDARVVDREVRSGSQMFRSRSCAGPNGGGGALGSFSRTGSLLGRVIRSASGRSLHNGASSSSSRASSDKVGGAGGANRGATTKMGRNASFGASNPAAPRRGHHRQHHPSHHRNHVHPQQQHQHRPQQRQERGATESNARHDLLVDFAPRSASGAGTGHHPSTKHAAAAAAPDRESKRPRANLFEAALGSANFVEMMGGAGGGPGPAAAAAPVIPPQQQQAVEPTRRSPEVEAAAPADATDVLMSSLENRFSDSLALEDCPTIQE